MASDGQGTGGRRGAPAEAGLPSQTPGSGEGKAGRLARRWKHLGPGGPAGLKVAVQGREGPAAREEHETVLRGWTVTMLDPYLLARWQWDQWPTGAGQPPSGARTPQNLVPQSSSHISFPGACHVNHIRVSLSHGAPGAGHRDGSLPWLVARGSLGLRWTCPHWASPHTGASHSKMARFRGEVQNPKRLCPPKIHMLKPKLPRR